jgi:hypothetical protein
LRLREDNFPTRKKTTVVTKEELISRLPSKIQETIKRKQEIKTTTEQQPQAEQPKEEPKTIVLTKTEEKLTASGSPQGGRLGQALIEQRVGGKISVQRTMPQPERPPRGGVQYPYTQQELAEIQQQSDYASMSSFNKWRYDTGKTIQNAGVSFAGAIDIFNLGKIFTPTSSGATPYDISTGLVSNVKTIDIERYRQLGYVPLTEARQSGYRSPTDIVEAELSTLQMPFYMGGLKALQISVKAFPYVSKFVSGGLKVSTGLFAVGAAKHVVEAPSMNAKIFDVASIGAQVAVGGLTSKPEIISGANRFKSFIGNNVNKYRDVTYSQVTGGITSRTVYDVFGVKVKSPFYQSSNLARGLDFMDYTPPGKVPGPPGIAQGPRWRPSTVSNDMATIYQGKQAYASPIQSNVWQPQTGIYEPTILKGNELVVTNRGFPVVRPSIGRLAEYDPMILQNPYIDNLNKTMDVLSKNWQQKTGIKYPTEKISIDKISTDTISNPLDVKTNIRPSIRKTVMNVDENGDVVSTRYGVTEKSKRWQPLTGTYESYIRTGFELGPVNPKPVVHTPYGKLVEYDPLVLNNPLLDDLNKTMNMMSKNWQPKTGIKWMDETTPTKKIDIETTSPLDIKFKLKPLPVKTTKINISTDGLTSIKKYGVNYLGITTRGGATGGIPYRTGKELGFLLPKPTKYIPPGKLSIWEPQLPYTSYLESGKTISTENLYKIIKTRKWKEGLNKFTPRAEIPKTKGTMEGTQIQTGGQQTILMKPEPTIVKQTTVAVPEGIQRGTFTMPVNKRKYITDMYTESEVEKITQQTNQIASTMQKSNQNSGYMSIFATTQKQKSASIQKQDFISLNKQIYGDITVSGQKQNNIINDIVNIVPIHITPTIPIYVPPRVPVTPKIKVPYIPTEDIPVKPPIIRLMGIETSDTKTKQHSEGYDVYVKERSYVRGKKRYPESWKKANTSPLSEDAALSLGGTAIDQSAAASFKIRPTDGIAKPLKFPVDPWGSISNKFYKKNGVYIESTSNRIDTSGEIKGISALGWIASRQKAFKPVGIPRQQKTTRVLVSPSFKAFDINQYMRGLKL